MVELSLKTSESNWHLELINSLKKQRTTAVWNNNSLKHSDFENTLNEIIEKFKLKPWHNKVRKLFSLLIPLASLGIIGILVYSIILQYKLDQTFFEMVNEIYPLIFILIASLVVSVKLIKAKKPILTFKEKAGFISWVNY